MTNKEKKDWLAVKYPLTVIRDRYDGTYSGAMWLAFPLGCDEVPEDVDGEDSECMYFWKNYQEPVGKGAYANDAVKDLIEQMRVSEPEESEELINFLQSPFIKENLTDEKVAPWIAYLEKQKEQKPSINIDQLKSLMLQYLQEAANEKDDSDIEADTDKWARKILGYNFEQKPAEWSEEDEHRLKLIRQCIISCPSISGVDGHEVELLKFLDSFRPQPRKEIYQAAKHDLAIKFMNYLDENRPEGKMSLSNGECEDIDKAFKENDWAKIMRYVEKYSYHWKPSEDEERLIKTSISFLKDFADKGYENAVECIDWLKSKLNEKSTDA